MKTISDVKNEVWWRVISQCWYHVGWQVRDQIWSQTYSQINGDHFMDQVRQQVWEEINENY